MCWPRNCPPLPSGVAEQHADAAVDVESGVLQRRSRSRRQRVKLLPVLAQHRAKRLEQRGPLMERQRAQRRAAGVPPVFQRRGHVDAGR